MPAAKVYRTRITIDFDSPAPVDCSALLDEVQAWVDSDPFDSEPMIGRSEMTIEDLDDSE